jgi:hypothetical protein
VSDEQTFDQRLTAKIQKDIEAFEADPPGSSGSSIAGGKRSSTQRPTIAG